MKKHIFHLLAATLLLFFSGCSKSDEGPKVAPSVVGEWHLTSWNGAAPTEFDIYMELKSDGTFDLYQKVSTSRYEWLTGSFTATQDRLTGRYSDGEPWSTAYTYAVSGDKLTMTSQTGTPVESVYTKSPIPDGVRHGGLVRSGETPAADGFRFL